MKKQITHNKKNPFISFIKIFLLIYIAVFVSEFILPASSKYNNFRQRFLLNIIFYSLVLFIAFFIYQFFKNTNTYSYKKKINYLTISKLKFLINWATFFGFIGMISLGFDRMFLKKIDYTLGLRNARYQWINASSPNIFSELLSMFGNFLIPMSYISILLLYLHWEEFSTKKVFRFSRSLISSIVIFLFAAANGSRSIVFIMIFLLLSVSIIRIILHKKIVPSKRKKQDKKIYFIFLFSVIYVLLVFNSSAEMGSMSSKNLFEILVNDLGGNIKRQYYSFINKLINSNNIIYHIFSTITYLIHSQWTTEALFSITGRNGNFFIYSITVFLYQLGMISFKPESYLFSGLFISLPGALVYDFGFLGLLLFSFIYGILLGIALLKVGSSKNSGGLEFAFIMFVFSSILIAPFSVAHNFIYFNFIIIDIVILEYLSRLFKKKSTWIYLK